MRVMHSDGPTAGQRGQTLRHLPAYERPLAAFIQLVSQVVSSTIPAVVCEIRCYGHASPLTQGGPDSPKREVRPLKATAKPAENSL